MRIAVIQGNYIPWIGYFALVSAVDKFLLYEDVQYTKNDWRNRNIIDRNGQPIWLTIPVRHKTLGQKYLETQVSSDLWAEKHLKSLQMNFGALQSWAALFPHLRIHYESAKKLEYLSEINWLFLKFIIDFLEIKTPIERVTSRPISSNPSDSLFALLKNHGATQYLSGPSARSYINDEAFMEGGIKVEYVNYDKLIKYEFPWVSRVRPVTIIQDILEGYDAIKSN